MRAMGRRVGDHLLQIINAVLKEPEGASPSMSLLLANQTEGDILVRDMLDDLQAKHPKQLRRLSLLLGVVKANLDGVGGA